jgi:hypothetical protein
MNSTEDAQNIINALQNAVKNVSNTQAGGRKRRGSKKSKKSMKGGNATALAPVQEGGKRRKSKASKKKKLQGLPNLAQSPTIRDLQKEIHELKSELNALKSSFQRLFRLAIPLC